MNATQIRVKLGDSPPKKAKQAGKWFKTVYVDGPKKEIFCSVFGASKDEAVLNASRMVNTFNATAGLEKPRLFVEAALSTKKALEAFFAKYNMTPLPELSMTETLMSLIINEGKITGFRPLCGHEITPDELKQITR